MPGTANLTNAGKGRVKGVPNKDTATIKDMILAALDKAGGVEYLRKQATANPVAFMTLVGKVLPLQVASDPDNPLKIVTIIELVAPERISLMDEPIAITSPLRLVEFDERDQGTD